MIEFDKMIDDLQNGYVFSFMYMNKEHKIMSFDDNHYSVTKYTSDNHGKREEKMIISIKILKEMWKGMTDLTYIY